MTETRDDNDNDNKLNIYFDGFIGIVLSHPHAFLLKQLEGISQVLHKQRLCLDLLLIYISIYILSLIHI